MPTADERFEALERMTKALESQGKGFMMIFAAVFAAMADDREAIQKAIDALKKSISATTQLDGGAAAVSLHQAMLLLEALAHRTN
jgi:hypothetical protein